MSHAQEKNNDYRGSLLTKIIIVLFLYTANAVIEIELRSIENMHGGIANPTGNVPFYSGVRY